MNLRKDKEDTEGKRGRLRSWNIIFYDVQFINKFSISSHDLCHITRFLVFIQPTNWILLV